MDSKMETTVECIIAELKKARDAQEPEKHSRLAAGFEALGDYYCEQSTQKDNFLECHRQALKAVALYQLAFASVANARLLEKIKAIESTIVLKSGGQPIKKNLDSYAQEIEHSKKRLQQLRSDAHAALQQANLGSPEIQTIYKTIATGLKSIVKEMIESCFNVLPPPVGCVYSIIALGSLAREEATPFSDFEWAILIEENNEAHKHYCRRLSELLWIKVINLGETTARMMDIAELDWFPESESPCRKGFSFDGQMLSGCHTPLGNRHHTANKIRAIEHNSLLSSEEKAAQIQKIKEGEYELIGTPEELAQFQSQRWATKTGFCTVLSTVAPIISNNDHLVDAYEANMEEVWNSTVESDPNQTLIQQRSLTYLAESVERFQFKGGHFGKETHYFDAKYHLYRLPNMLLDHLSSYFGIQSKNLWDRIEHIFGETGVVNLPKKSTALKQVVSQVLGLRLRAYLKKEYRDDRIVMLDPQNPEKNAAALKKYLGVDETLLLQIYSEFIELQWRMESFIEERGAAAALAWQYGDASDIMKGEVYRILLNYPKAAEAFEKAKLIMKEVFGVKHFHVAEALNNLGLVYMAQARYPEAIVALKESKRIKKDHYGASHLCIATALNNLGAVYVSQVRYDDAIVAYEKAERIILAAPNPDRLSVANTQNNLGVVYEAQHRYPEAIAAYERAKEIKIKIYGLEHIAVAGTLNNLGNVYASHAPYLETAPPLEEAEVIRIVPCGSEHPSVEAWYGKAITLLKEAQRIIIAIYGPEHPSVAETLNNLAAVYSAQAQYDEAIATYEEAKRIMIAAYGSKHLQVGLMLNNLGAAYQSQGLYSKAIESYNEAKNIIIASLGSQHLWVTEIWNSLGLVYYAQARYGEAIGAYKEATKHNMNGNNSSPHSVAETLNNLGAVYTAQGRYPEAIAVLEEASRILSHCPEHPIVAESQINMGQVCIEQRRFEEARAFFKAAIIVYERAQHPNQATPKNFLDASYIREGNVFMLQQEMEFHRAASCYEKASSTVVDPQDPKLHQALANQFYGDGQLTAALDHFRILIRLAPDNASAHHNLACLIHARAGIELNNGKSEHALKYIKEAEAQFELAIELGAHSGVCTEYAHFLWKNRDYYESKKIIALLQQAIALNQTGEVVSYRYIDRSTLDQYLQGLLDQENLLSFKAIYLAHYLLIQVYCATDQLAAAQTLCRDFNARIKKDEEAYELTQMRLCTEIKELIEANSEQEAERLSTLQQQFFADETLSRLHAKLVEGSQAAIERCLLPQLHRHISSIDSTTVSPRLSRDSPIFAAEAANKTNSAEKGSEVSLNRNL